LTVNGKYADLGHESDYEAAWWVQEEVFEEIKLSLGWMGKRAFGRKFGRKE